MALKRQKGLGRGLNAIFDIESVSSDVAEISSLTAEEKKSAELSSIMELELSLIDPNPNQPRTSFNNDTIAELSNSIASLGVIQPITVMKGESDRYTIISGERRFRAAKLLKMGTIPAYIRKGTDEPLLEMALVENIQREDLNPLEIAISLDRLIRECSITQEKLSERIGKSRTSISNYIRLLRLPASVQLALAEGELSMGHAKALLSLNGDDIIEEVAYRVTSMELSVRETEQLVKRWDNVGETVREESKPFQITGNYAKLQRSLKGLVSGKVVLSETSKGEKKVTITLKNDDDLNKLLGKLK